MAASQAIAFLNTIGAKAPNVYIRVGRKPRLSWKLKGKTFGVDLEDDDVDSGVKAIPKIRDIIQSASADSSAAKMLRAIKDYSTGGARLKYVREEATLTRAKLSEATGIAISVIKDIEDNRRSNLEEFLDTEQIINVAKTCRTDPNWLAGHKIVEPEPDTPPPPKPDKMPSADALAGLESLITAPLRPDEYPAIGARIREARKAIGMTQRSLGDQFEVTGVSIGNMEKGKSSFLWGELPKIAEVLQTTILALRIGNTAVAAPTEPAAPEPAPEPPPVKPPVVETDYAAIGERIRLARNALGMSQSTLTDLLGVPATVVSKAERGENNIVITLLDEVAEHLNTTEDWLDTGTGPPPKGVGRPEPSGPGLRKAPGREEPAPVPWWALSPDRTPAPRPAPTVRASTMRAPLAAPVVDIAGLQKHLDHRLDMIEQMAMVRHEELRLTYDEIKRRLKAIEESQGAEVQVDNKRYLRAIYRLLRKQEEAPTTVKRKKSKGAAERGKRAFETRMQHIREAAARGEQPPDDPRQAALWRLALSGASGDEAESVITDEIVDQPMAP